MRSKVFKKLILISAVALVAVLALVFGVFFQSSQPIAQAADSASYLAEYQGNNGRVDGPYDGHFGMSDIASRYGVAQGSVMAIDTGAKLYNFLNNQYPDKAVGYLTGDVAISYNIDRDGYDRINVNSSSAVFDKVFDGNGYTIKLHGGEGAAESTQEIKDDQDDRLTRRNGMQAYAGCNLWYEYSGFLVAQNYGTIANVTIDYTSPHVMIAATQGSQTSPGGLGNDTKTGMITSARPGIFSMGIVAGINGYNGVIDNVKLNVANAFVAVKLLYSNKTGEYTENTCYAGGIAGRIEDNSRISNCWVDLAATAGVMGVAQGKNKSWPTDTQFSMAVVGGIVGNIDGNLDGISGKEGMGSGKILSCVLSGEGQVKAFANMASDNSNFIAFAGGVAGGVVYMNGSQSIWASEMDILVREGQIRGIMSSWRGVAFTNHKNSPTFIMGSLFGSVGTDDVIQSIALLYDLEDLISKNPNAIRPVDGKTTLDMYGKVANFLEIHPTTDGGNMYVKFNNDGSQYDIRVHIIADGHDELKNGVLDEENMSGSRFRQFKAQEGQGGNIIWSAKFESASDSSNHINLALDDPVYAEIYMLSSTNTGKYNYEFGRLGELNYSDTNGNNGVYVKNYNGISLRLPNVSMPDYPSYDTSVFLNESLWKIMHNDVSGGVANKVKLTQTYMPGTYSMNLETTLGDRTYGYYSEQDRLLAWQPSSAYSFTILPGELLFGEGTTSTDGWQSSVMFELTMKNNANKDIDTTYFFDTIEFQRNGAFPEDSAEGFVRRGESVEYTVTAGTGKNGTVYTFYAYKYDTVLKKSVLVASSEPRMVRIDTERPEISEKEYYIVENNKERLLSEEELDEIQENWTTNQILVKYTVTDNGKSGVASVATDLTYIDNTELPNGDYEVVVTINDSAPKRLLYVDARGNEEVVELQFNVDRVQGVLQFGGSSYQTGSGLNYCRSNVTIRYKAFFGMSGWKMYYSYQRDASGNDIWIARSDQDQMQDSGANKSFIIDWNMGDVRSGQTAGFKIKMVNLAGLYDDVYPTGYGDSFIGEYIIWRRIADIFLDTSFNNVYLEVEGGEDISIADILASGNAATYFDKEYDGTDSYSDKKSYKFYTDVSKLNDTSFISDEKVGAIYSTAFSMSRPLINLGEGGKLPVELRYDTSNVGSVKLNVSVPLSGADQYNYAFYFTNLSEIDFVYDVEAAPGTYWSEYGVNANITKREVIIELGAQEALKKTYYYGDLIPQSIDVFVEATGETIPIALKSDALNRVDINSYSVSGSAPSGLSNIEYTINSTVITINKRLVSVDLLFDEDNIVGNIPTGVQAGTAHTIKGTYDDVDGNPQSVIVRYFLDDVEVDALAGVGLYRYEISLADPNYTIDGQTSFKFNVAKGFLSVTTGTRVVDYSDDFVKYNLIIPQEATGLYGESDLEILYYPYFEGATFDEMTNKVTGTYSLEPMTSLPKEIGKYHVKVRFITKDHPNFFEKEYEDGDLVIVQAATRINVEYRNDEVPFDASLFTFDMRRAITEVRSSSNDLLWSSSSEPAEIIKVYYNKDGRYVEVPETKIPGEGWYSEVGSYRYKIEYQGDVNYGKSEIIVNLIINKAVLKNITFTQDVYEYEYDGKVHLPIARGLNGYMGLSVMYQMNSRRYTSIDDIRIVNANDAPYVVTMYVNKEGYQECECETRVIIKKAKMQNVSAKAIDEPWNNERKTVTLLGLKGNAEDGYYYEDGITEGGVPVVIIEGDSEGNYYATNVKIDPELGVTNYSGQIVLRALNYEDLTINTYIMIRQIELNYKEIGKTLPYKVPSGMSLTAYNGYFVSANGTKVDCELEYYKGDQLVKPDENGTLADGKYTVKIVIPNSNYYINDAWKFEIGEINSKEISALGFVAIGAVVALMAAAVITAVVVVNKRKKAGIV